jgi:hypothetical protein
MAIFSRGSDAGWEQAIPPLIYASVTAEILGKGTLFMRKGGTLDRKSNRLRLSFVRLMHCSANIVMSPFLCPGVTRSLFRGFASQEK